MLLSSFSPGSSPAGSSREQSTAGERENVRVGVVLYGALSAVGVAAAFFPIGHRHTVPTFAADVAPLVYAKCAPCHRPGQAGPFSLLTYEDVSRRAAQIKKVTSQRFMPPWRPAHDGVAFAGDRSLTDAQIDLLARWALAGAPLGDPKAVPPEPTWPSGWQLGTPDVVVTLREPYVLHPEGRDVYRNFVIKAPVDGVHYVAAWEFRPGSRAVHHAILNVDRLGLARKRDGEDGKPGWDGMDVGNAQSADGFYLVWAPGMTPSAPNPARAWRIDGHTDLVLQLHMQPRGKEETVNPSIALYFTDRPPAERLVSVRIGDRLIDIPPGDRAFTMRDDYVLPTDVDVVSLFPHAHYLATTFKSWATLPDRSVRELLRIDRWDFNWQDAYTYVTPVHLPAGTTLSMRVTYDNSADNPHNPSHPPVRVVTGPRTTDEMGNVTFEVAPDRPDGEAKLRISKYERLLGGAETAKNHYNLANALADDGRADDAVVHYERAIALDPALAPAEFNLANVLFAKRDLAGAALHYRKAIAAKPDHFDARLNLGHVLEAEGKRDEAIAAYRELVGKDPRNVLGHASLGVALAAGGDKHGATSELEEAAEIDPKNPQIRAALEQVDGQR